MTGPAAEPNARLEPGREAPPPETLQHKVLTSLTDPHWYWLLIPAGIIAFALGFWGYGSYEGGEHSYSDAVYGAVKLFFLHAAPQPENHVGAALDIARFLAPVVAGWAALIALVSMFRDRVQQLLIPFKHGHVVVCGLGYAGFEFVRALRAAGYRAVVIESDEANPRIRTCRNWGFPVVIGDAQLSATLESAGVRRAARLLAVTSDSVANTEIVTLARRLADDSKSSRRIFGRSSKDHLRCLARIEDPGLCVLLRLAEFNRGDDRLAVDFFNIDTVGARLLLAEYPLRTVQRPHIAVAHLDGVGSGLVFQAARQWHDERVDDQPLRVTVIDDQAAAKVAKLVANHPALEEVCEFHCAPASVRDIDWVAQDTDWPVTQAYVTGYHDEHNVETALNLRRALDKAVPVVTTISRAYGVADLLEEQALGGSGVTVFRTLQQTCTVELVEGGSLEAVAHEIHRRYCLMQPAGAPAPPPWPQLADALKDSSRAQARHIGVKLRSIGCVIAPLRNWHARDFQFTDDEMDKLGTMEHDRWMQEKLDAGWTLGEEDPVRKKDPHLVPMEQLPPEVAEVDRIFVRAIPEMLAAVGLEIIDVAQTAPRYPARSLSH
ncbi:NAD-binding protein [Mycobacterium sp. SMC-11]|uniref:NAD-binding protein n=1 Tax=Mycobacterium sp. SMC-11 TaxID=3385969 RepID=UPI00390C9E21